MPKHRHHRFSEDVLPLQQNYLRRITGYIGDVRRIKEIVKKDSFPIYDLHRLLRLSHNLIGSGATYGFPGITLAAQKLYIALDKSIKGEFDHASKERHESEILEKLFGFEDACIAAVNRQPIINDAKEKITRLRLVPSWMAEKTIYLVSKMPGQQEALSARLRQYGYIPKDIILSGLNAELCKGFFHAIILYSDNPEKDLVGFPATDAPFIVVSSNNRLEARLAAIRVGANDYLPINTEPAEIIKKIDDIILYEMRPIQKYRVLISYSDAEEAETYASALKIEGYEVMITTTPNDTLHAIEHQTFDLVIVSAIFSMCTGLELAAIIRQSPSLKNQPVLLIADADQIYDVIPSEVMLIKPFASQQLVSLVKLWQRVHHKLQLNATEILVPSPL